LEVAQDARGASTRAKWGEKRKRGGQGAQEKPQGGILAAVGATQVVARKRATKNPKPILRCSSPSTANRARGRAVGVYIRRGARQRVAAYLRISNFYF
jgi:hypothetical protein